MRVPQEDLSSLETDLILWTHTADQAATFDKIPLRPTLTAYAQGREIYTDYDLTAALSLSSPLSLDYALDHIVPLMEAALDVDPETIVLGMEDYGKLTRERGN